MPDWETVRKEQDDQWSYWHQPWELSQEQQKNYQRAILIAPPVAVFGYGLSAWKWGNTPNFRSAHEGLMGQNTPYGGQDKLGHMWFCYGITRLTNWALVKTSPEEKKLRWQSVAMGAGLGIGIEIGDGFGKSYGFSFDDLILDLTGVALAAFLDSSSFWNDFIGFSWQWVPSQKWQNGDLSKKIDLTEDYDGMKFYLNMRLRALPWFRHNIFQYLQTNVGYYTRGYKSEDDPRPPKRRHLTYGLTLDLSRVLNQIKPEAPTLHYVGTGTEYYQLPIVVPVHKQVVKPY